MKILHSLFILVALAASAFALSPPQTKQAAAQIDALLAADWTKNKLPANAPISDETFIRRIYLDLAGRIPTSAEAVAFLESKQPQKRAALIDDLLARESYVSHFYNYWADVLRHKSTHPNRSGVIEAAYEKYLKESLRTNKAYDQLVRELLSARGYAWDNAAVGYYGRDPEMPLENMALTSRVFLGTRIECAQCHNHPFDKWKQTEFYHLAAYTYGNASLSEALGGFRIAFHAREEAVLDDFKKEKAAAGDGGQAAEQRKKERLDALEMRNVLNIARHGIGQLFSPIGLERKAEAVLKLPHDFHQDDGKAGDPMTARPIFGDAPVAAPGADPAALFANWVASPENPRFTRVIVNRLWKQMFGVALTEPLDELRDDTQAMVPAVEAELMKLMVSLKYDLRGMLAVIANTRAYQSAVRPEEFALGTGFHFQGPLLRRMTAEQAWDSLVALASYEPDARDLEKEAGDQRRIDISHMACDAYLGFDGEKLLELALTRLQGEKEIQRGEATVRAEMIAARRRGDTAREIELKHQDGDLERERNQAYVREFLMPLLTKLARDKTGSEANLTSDESYKMNPNPVAFAIDTWRKMHIPGYGPPPKTAAEVEAAAGAKKERLAALAARLGFSGNEAPGFVRYCENAGTAWLRASELESPAPRGHFLRTMGQSDRDFVENSNPNASIPQALTLMNGDLLSPKGLLSPYSPLMHAVNQARSPADRWNAIYLALLSRRPTPAEVTALEPATAQSLGSPADLIYALLNTKQFIFIQ